MPENSEVEAITGILATLDGDSAYEIFSATRAYNGHVLAAVAAYEALRRGPVVSAAGDGVTDDTAVIQDAIDACPAGGTVRLPVGVFKLTSAVTIDKDITIQGSGVGAAVGAAGDSSNGSGPLTSPYLTGSVLLPSTAGQNGLEVVGTGISVTLRDFGIRFASGIMFDDTGHGVYCVSPDTVTVGKDLSVFSPLWENIRGFGHDGDHYGFYIANPLMGTFLHLRSFGGGGIFLEGEHDDCVTGNSVLVHPYVWMFVGGTADSYTLKSQRQGLNLVEFIRPQTIVSPVPGTFSGLGLSDPSLSQYMWRHDGSDIDRISIYDPDLESSAANPVDFGGDGANVIVRPGGLFSGPDASDVIFGTQRLGIDINTNLTVTAGAAAGTGGVASTPYGARDHGCRIRIVSGTSPGAAGSLVCSVTFGVEGTRDAVVLQPTEATPTAALGLFTFGLSTSGFDVYTQAQMAENTTYDFHFIALKAYE